MRIEVEVDGAIEVVTSRVRLVEIHGELLGGSIWDIAIAEGRASYAIKLPQSPANDTRDTANDRFVDVPVYGIKCT